MSNHACVMLTWSAVGDAENLDDKPYQKKYGQAIAEVIKNQEPL